MIVDIETRVESLKSDPRCFAVRVKTHCGRFITVGHVPREISRYIYYFIRHGGMIDGHVADLAKRRSPIPAGGTEINLKLFF